jgi:hypothetical protein
MTQVLYVRVPDEIKERLDALASETGLSLRAVAEVVLSKGLGIPPDSLRVIKLLGLLGDDESIPADRKPETIP